jgi:hypothetical protein
MRQSAIEASKSYNRLLDLKGATSKLFELGGEDTVGKILSVIKAQELEELISVRLLHKHNDISDQEIMLETAMIDEEGIALITAATARNSIGKTSCNSWQFIDGRYIEIEFSDPCLLVNSAFNIVDHKYSSGRNSRAVFKLWEFCWYV